MKDVAVSELRRHLTDMIDTVVRTGDELVITRRGRPIARVVPIKDANDRGPVLSLRGVPIEVADDFDAPLPELWNTLTDDR